MPCKSCGKDHGKFYGGYCPECLEAHNASCAALREALEAVIPYLECGALEGDDAVHLLPMVEAAIAKAKGGSKIEF